MDWSRSRQCTCLCLPLPQWGGMASAQFAGTRKPRDPCIAKHGLARCSPLFFCFSFFRFFILLFRVSVCVSFFFVFCSTFRPYNIGRPPIFPMPTWKEREFAPVQYGTAGEQAVVALTALCIALCAVLLALVLANHRAPVIRAATPSFCAVIILGAILMLASNFFATLSVVDDAQCAASTWLLTVGFTLTFAALFIKTFRIWFVCALAHTRAHSCGGKWRPCFLRRGLTVGDCL
jgi:hypothetical protein